MTSATAQSAQTRNLTPEELAFLVKLNRDYRQWSQEQLAEISGLSARTVQRVEEGLSSSVDTRHALARARAFDVEDIDAFNKPYDFPTEEQIAADKARFEKERVTLKAVRVETGKQLAKFVETSLASMFSAEGALPQEVEMAFAQLSDYYRDYADCAELYSATGKLEVFADLDALLSTLSAAGYSLVAATREVELKAPGAPTGRRDDILYAVLFPRGKEPETFAVQREVRLG